MTTYLEDHGAGSSASGFGTPDTTGDPWTHPSGATDQTRSGGFLVSSLPSATTRVARNGLGGTKTDYRITGRVNLSDLTGSSLVAYHRMFLRDDGSENTCYEARVGFAATGAVQLALMRRVANVATTIVSNTQAFTGYTTSDFVQYVVEIEGAGSTVTVRMRAWKDGTSDPGTWTWTFDDTDAARITTAGTHGQTAQSLAGFTGTFPLILTHDDIVIGDLSAGPTGTEVPVLLLGGL